MIKRFICFAVLCLLIVLFSLTTALLFNGCASTPDLPVEISISYTTDSEITPYELFTWESIYVSPPDKDTGVFYIVAENPLFRMPIDCPIKYVLVRVDYETGKLTGYAYYIDSHLYIYELQPKDESLSSGHFTEAEVTEFKRRLIDYFLLKFLDMDRT